MLAKVRSWFATEPRVELQRALGDAPVPSFQPAVINALKVLRDPNADATKIGEAIAVDPGLSVRVLRLVNSPAYGLKRSVNNVPHAAAMVGRSGLEQLVLAVAVKSAVPKGPGTDQTFWRTASHRAAIARALASRVDPSRESLCFSAGLLQDMAVPLLSNARPEHAALCRAASDPHAMARMEESRFGWDHADVAGWLCEAWGFPDSLRAAVAGHHSGEDAPLAVRVVASLDHHTQEDPDAFIALVADRFDLREDMVVEALRDGTERGDELANALARP